MRVARRRLRWVRVVGVLAGARGALQEGVGAVLHAAARAARHPTADGRASTVAAAPPLCARPCTRRAANRLVAHPSGRATRRRRSERAADKAVGGHGGGRWSAAKVIAKQAKQLDVLAREPRRQRLRQLLSLLRILHRERVQVARAADLELRPVRLLLDLHRSCVVPPCLLQEVADVGDLLRLRERRGATGRGMDRA